MRRFAKVALLILSMVMVCAPSAKANLVLNGGFETGDFSDWSLTGSTDHTGVDNGLPHSGTYSGYFGAENGDGILMQSLATTNGDMYTFSFWLYNQQGTPNDFSALWNNSPLLSLTDAPGFGYTEYTFSVVGTGADKITFNIRQNPAYFFLDDVSVNPVPEPASLLMLATGLIGVASCVRRRAKLTRSALRDPRIG